MGWAPEGACLVEARGVSEVQGADAAAHPQLPWRAGAFLDV